MSSPLAVPSSARAAAFGWAVRACGVIALLSAGVVLLERAVLAYPARLGPVIEGFPVDTLESLARVRGDVAFFGDSIVQTVALHDSDSRLLPDMVADELHVPVVRVSQAATGAELHAAWLDYVASRRIAPRAVVVPVNPRSFSPHWERNPPWVFTGIAAGIRHPIVARLARVLEWSWGVPTAEEYAASSVVVGGHVVGTIAQLDQGVDGEPGRIAHDRYLVRYAADYARSERIHAFRALVDEANRQSFPVILYLTPVDVEGARAELDAAEMAAVEINLELLRSELARSRWPTVDATTLVDHADFDHPHDDPHEHLRGRGRIAVAERVAAVLRTALELDAPERPTAEIDVDPEAEHETDDAEPAPGAP